MAALRQIALPQSPQPLVFCIDEVDTVRSLPFPTDEFFAAIRECYNRRVEDATLERLTFCLFGVASPTDLIRDTRMTPFNIGHRIELEDFTPAEAAPLMQGLRHADATNQTLLARILFWTNGHPYLTQCLCRRVAEEEGPVSVRQVDQLCSALFLSPCLA